MPKPSPRTTYRYSPEFKATAVRLSQLPGVSVADVADSLYIHPFMLSRWRRLAREGQIMTKGVDVDSAVAAELKGLRRVRQQYERLKLEHDLLKKPSRSLRLERRRLRLHPAPPGNAPGEVYVPHVRRQPGGLLRLGVPPGKSAFAQGWCACGEDPPSARQ